MKKSILAIVFVVAIVLVGCSDFSHEHSWKETFRVDDTTTGEGEIVYVCIGCGEIVSKKAFLVKDEVELKNAIAVADASKPIYIMDDISLSETVEINGGKSVEINLDGKTISMKGLDAKKFAIVVDGEDSSLTIEGEGSIETDKRIINVLNGGSLILNGGKYISKSHAIVAGSGLGSDPVSSGTIMVNKATVEAQEFCLTALADSKLIVNGGVFSSSDNAVIGTSGDGIFSSHSYDITINGGEFNGKITTDGYIACGVYVANSGKVTLNGGVFNIEGGVGILVRSGELVANKVEINLTKKSGLTEGKVGDSTIVITDGSQIVLDDKAGYPGSAPVVSENKTSYSVKDVNGTPITNAE